MTLYVNVNLCSSNELYNQLKVFRSHNVNEKTYVCVVCYEVFKKRRIFKNHIKNHLDKKMFACNACSKVFSHFTSFDEHSITHAAKITLSCKKCVNIVQKSGPMIFFNEENCSDKKPYGCKVCSKKFSTSCSLTVHISNKHNEQKIALNGLKENLLAHEQFDKLRFFSLIYSTVVHLCVINDISLYFVYTILK